MIGQVLGRLAFAEKLSIPQLEEALENRTIPAYIGVPLLEEKIQMKERMQMAQTGMSPPPQMTIEEEIFARANQAQQGMDQVPMEQGIDQLPVQMPEYAASGGIVDFAEGGEVIRAFNGLPQDMYQDDGPPVRGIIPSVSQAAKGLATGVSDYFQGGIYNDIAQLLRLGYTDAQISQMSPNMRSNIAKQTRDVAPVDVQQDPGIAPAVTPQDVAPTNAPPAAPPPASSPTQDPGIAPAESTVGSPPLSMPGLIGRTEQLYSALYGDQKPKAPDDKSDYLNRAQDFFTQAGVDLNMASKQAEEVARQKADLEGDRREAKKYSVISAGLAILAGDPASSVAENIGKGLGRGMEQYTTAIKDIKKTEREMQSLERSLEVAQNQSRMGLATVAAGDYQAAQKRYDDLNKEMRSNKADLAKALMTDDRARQVVQSQMQGGAFEKTFQIELNNLAAQGKDPKDAKIVKQARDAAYKSAGATQLSGQMSTDYRKAADIVAQKLGKLVSNESRELRRINKEEGAQAGERYKDELIEAEAARIRRGEGSGGDSAPAPIGVPMPSKKEELKTGQVYETKQGLGRWDGKQFVSVQ